MADLLIFVLGAGVGGVVVWLAVTVLRPGRPESGWSVRSIEARLEYERKAGRVHRSPAMTMRGTPSC
ncbi:hypothetical protein [Nocardia cyriacigeorgica]|uniref:hypothetical protein n=1 Tax=Nocardia cyriacigeorgica TaxID=135487 RepID=UPI00189471E7|nr:hypothetical protein [Nocardia cyriacigeorgica]MBF6416863.1 hypothetical protein [Nocardia cyriacigeorgica]